MVTKEKSTKISLKVKASGILKKDMNKGNVRALLIKLGGAIRPNRRLERYWIYL